MGALSSSENDSLSEPWQSSPREKGLLILNESGMTGSRREEQEMRCLRGRVAGIVLRREVLSFEWNNRLLPSLEEIFSGPIPWARGFGNILGRISRKRGV